MKFHRFIIGILVIGITGCMHTGSDDGVHMGSGHGSMHSNAKGFLPGSNVDLKDLPAAKPQSTIEVKDGETIELNPAVVQGTIGSTSLPLYAYNGQFPGPTIKVKQGSTFTVKVRNDIDMETTVHWHGVRIDNRFDGAAGVTQKAIAPGESFTYTVTVPDEGIFWYHPHVREDIQQDAGLYGSLWVTPKNETAYSPVDAEEVIMLDDMLLSKGKLVPYGGSEANYALMGRFGNTMLANGKTDLKLQAKAESRVRYYITNAANTRTLNLHFRGAEMILVGSDGGRLPEERKVSSVILSPSERAIIEVVFPAKETAVYLESVTPVSTERFAMVKVIGNTKPSAQDSPQTNVDVQEEIESLRPFFAGEPEETLRLTAQVTMGMMNHAMHESTSDDGIEWEDSMPHMNAMSSKGNTQWKLVDAETGQENMDIRYAWKVGSKVKVRLVNAAADDGSDHPMHHPIHFHGQRFLVLATDGVENENLAWKDTVLVPSGKTVDILLEITNPGTWMIHCHIAEHLSNGMMASFVVKP